MTQASGVSALVDDKLGGRIWAPTEVQKYLLCPTRWLYERLLGSRTSQEMALGTAIHLAMESGSEMAQANLEASYDPGWAVSLDGLVSHLKVGADMLTKWQASETTGEQVVGMEIHLDGYHTRLDMVTRRSDGLIVTNWKTKLSMDLNKLPYELQRAQVSWQSRHECWAAREYFQEPITQHRTVYTILTPRRKVHSEPLDINDNMLNNWLASAEIVWQDMSKQWESKMANMNTLSCWAFNRQCEWYDICHKYHGKWELAQEWVNKPIVD